MLLRRGYWFQNLVASHMLCGGGVTDLMVWVGRSSPVWGRKGARVVRLGFAGMSFVPDQALSQTRKFAAILKPELQNIWSVQRVLKPRREKAP